MKTIVIRFIITLTAITLGVLMMTGMAFIGSSSKGPIEDLSDLLGDGINSMENNFILSQRKTTRSTTLKWLVPYKKDISKLKKPNCFLFGAYDNGIQTSFQPIVSLEKSLHTTFPLIHIYTAWGSKTNEQFPTDKVKEICSLGSIPVITWEPWLTAFDAVSYPNLPTIDKRETGGLKSITAGYYDVYIKQWASDVKKIDQPIFIRLAHEMNDPYRYPWGPQNNAPEDFIAAWKHITTLFKEAGVMNVIWIWSPHPAYDSKAYYPGDQYVDWIGTGTLNYGNVAAWSQWWSFEDTFKKFYTQVSSHNKPIMITEFGCLNAGGNRSQWYTEAMQHIAKDYPNVKSLIFYHSSDDNTTTNKTLNWQIVNDKPLTENLSKIILSWPKAQ